MTQVRFLPIPAILGIIFITLKLSGIGTVAAWSWWWVLAPFYFPLLALFTLASVAYTLVSIIKYFEAKDKK